MYGERIDRTRPVHPFIPMRSWRPRPSPSCGAGAHHLHAELAAAPITTPNVVIHDAQCRDGGRTTASSRQGGDRGRRTRSGALRASMRDRGQVHAELAAAPVRNALRAFSGRSQGVGVMLAWESGGIGRREALRGAQGVESGQGSRMCRAWARWRSQGIVGAQDVMLAGWCEPRSVASA